MFDVRGLKFDFSNSSKSGKENGDEISPIAGF